VVGEIVANVRCHCAEAARPITLISSPLAITDDQFEYFSLIMAFPTIPWC
jgi:hypothetical protein